MKIAVYYDTLVDKGGAERVAILLANHLNADLITAGYDLEISQWMPIKAKVVNLGNLTLPFSRPLGILFEAPLRYYLNRNKLDYDIHIFLGFSSIYGSNKKNKNIWLCFTPNRMLYDLKEQKLNYPNIIGRLIFHIYIRLFGPLDQKVVQQNFQKIIAQTKTVQDRISKYYGKPSQVIYSPLNTSLFTFKKFADFYVTVSRLFAEKRIDLIARAFTKMPDKKLVIVGTGPEEQKIKNIISSAKNITLLSNVDDRELSALYSECFATIFMPFNEDYGLIPIEGMASGKAAIAVNEGGCREVVIDNKTGYLIQPTEQAIIKVVQSHSLKKAEAMKESCQRQARKFGIDEIMKSWRLIIKEVYESNP
jgi:glycosyltransferase involved in cell wall biosynthesis